MKYIIYFKIYRVLMICLCIIGTPISIIILLGSLAEVIDNGMQEGITFFIQSTLVFAIITLPLSFPMLYLDKRLTILANLSKIIRIYKKNRKEGIRTRCKLNTTMNQLFIKMDQLNGTIPEYFQIPSQDYPEKEKLISVNKQSYIAYISYLQEGRNKSAREKYREAIKYPICQEVFEMEDGTLIAELLLHSLEEGKKNPKKEGGGIFEDDILHY